MSATYHIFCNVISMGHGRKVFYADVVERAEKNIWQAYVCGKGTVLSFGANPSRVGDGVST